MEMVTVVESSGTNSAFTRLIIRNILLYTVAVEASNHVYQIALYFYITTFAINTYNIHTNTHTRILYVRILQ
jgi:hypothetical protein